MFYKAEECGSIAAFGAEGCTFGAFLINCAVGAAAADLNRIQRAAGLPRTVVGTLVDGTADVVVGVILIHRKSPPNFFGFVFGFLPFLGCPRYQNLYSKE